MSNTMSTAQAPEDRSCFICRKHAGLEEAPPGGYIYSDEHWRVCHAPANMAVPGQLFIESRRHFLDFAQMTATESASFGLLLPRLFAAGKAATGAERIYALAMIDGVPHFHFWLVPLTADAASRGLAFLAEDHACTDEEAAAAAAALRARLA
jgi:diadenosine tetraphosphate (Ap4A) HIT family hydrolase